MKIAVIAVLVAAVIATVAASHVRGSHANVVDQFRAFGMKYNKTYATEAEWQSRFLVFTANMKKIEQLNAAEAAHGNKMAPFGINEFADMSPEEFKATKLGYVPAENKAVSGSFSPKGVSLPAEVDWRQKGAVSAVKNQGQCGSCWAFSATEEIESMWFLAGHPMVELSVQQIVSCDTTDSGCGGGEPYNAYGYVQSAGGLDTEAAYPYTDANGDDDATCNFNSGGIAASISGYQWAAQNGDESALQEAVATVGPISTCVEADTWQYYTGGILSSNCGNSLDHCVQTVGYGSDSGVSYWLVRNSWGTTWGEAGYIRIQIGSDLCGIADEATYVTI